LQTDGDGDGEVGRLNGVHLDVKINAGGAVAQAGGLPVSIISWCV
jgi:hypothetical protein